MLGWSAAGRYPVGMLKADGRRRGRVSRWSRQRRGGHAAAVAGGGGLYCCLGGQGDIILLVVSATI